MPLDDEPLSNEEFDQLDSFLLSDRCPEDAMTMDTLHGFLTAIVIGPESVPVSEWLPRVWGSSQTEPVFASEKEREQITELILRFMREIALIFEVAPKDYEPLFCEEESKGKMLIDAEGWAMGFWEGLNLRPGPWGAIWSSEMAALMQPFYLLGADELDETEAKLVDSPAKRHKLALSMEAHIGDIRRFWQRREKTDSAPSAGGSGPCPCGSGKKYRQCCGAEPTLH